MRDSRSTAAAVMAVDERRPILRTQHGKIGRQLGERISPGMPVLRRDCASGDIDAERQETNDERHEAPAGTPPLNRREWLVRAHVGLLLSESAHDTGMQPADKRKQAIACATSHPGSRGQGAVSAQEP